MYFHKYSGSNQGVLAMVLPASTFSFFFMEGNKYMPGCLTPKNTPRQKTILDFYLNLKIKYENSFSRFVVSKIYWIYLINLTPGLSNKQQI